METNSGAAFLDRWNPFHADNYVKAVQLAAAIGVGVGAYLFTLVATQAQDWFGRAFEFGTGLTCLAAPLLFVLSAWLVRRYARKQKAAASRKCFRPLRNPARMTPMPCQDL
jgi:hypothetical protein